MEKIQYARDTKVTLACSTGEDDSKKYWIRDMMQIKNTTGVLFARMARKAKENASPPYRARVGH